MAIRKYIIHCLLVFCIGLQPALSAIVTDADHSAPAPVHGLDCDPAEMGVDGACANMDCDSITHSCGSQAGANYLPVSALVENIPLAQTSDRNLNDPEYRQSPTDPIYRPPIT